MSEVLSIIDINDYGPQSMVSAGGGGTEDLDAVLAAQDTALSSQQTKIEQMVQALANKKSIDLQQETADATAVAGDIADGKTAYVNGVKVTGTAEGSSLDWTQLGYSSAPQVLIDNFNYSKNIYDNWDNTQTSMVSMFLSDLSLKYMPFVDTSNITLMGNAFKGCTFLEYIPLLNTSNVTGMNFTFYDTKELKTIPLLDTGNVTSMYQTFYNTNIENIPVLNTGKLTNMTDMFKYSYKLTNESLNNILAMCINATSYTGTKTLAYIGLTSAQATTCQTLSNYNDFINAGWTTGY